MWIWQAPIILLTFWMWLQSPPGSLAEASRREALRRQLMPASVRALSNEDVDRVPFRPAPSPGIAAEAEGNTVSSGGAAGAGAAPSTSAAAPASPRGASEKLGEPHDEAWWRNRVAQTREALERDQVLAEALQSRINGLTTDWSARDDPAARQALFEQRERALKELQRMSDQIAADRKAVADIEEDARRQDVPAGWVR